MSKSKYVSGTQFALFFRETRGSSLDVYMQLRECTDPLFDGDPLVIPVPQDFPSNAPSVIARANDGSISLDIAMERIDLIFSSPNGNERFTWDQKNEVFAKVLNALNVSCDFSRFGCTVSFIEIVDEPAKLIRERYLSPKVECGPFCNEVSLRFNDPFLSENQKYNRVTTVQNAGITIDNVFYDGILTSVDINSDQTRTIIGKDAIDFILEEATKTIESEIG